MDSIIGVFERGLIFMHKMPRIWIMYGEFMISIKKVSKSREVLDRGLEALPLSQHEKIWSIYREWILSLPKISSVVLSMRRYFQLMPDNKELLIQYLIKVEDYDQSVKLMKEIYDDDQFVSSQGKSKYDILVEMCKLMSTYPANIKSVDCANVMRQGIRQYTDEVGNLWVCLAEYYIRQGFFDRARDVFEEALDQIYTVRDFAIIFNSYIKLEQELIHFIDYQQDAHQHQQHSDELYLKQIDSLLDLHTLHTNYDIQSVDQLEFRIQRLEQLLKRRQLLINNCLLRKNKHNIEVWLNRFEILQSNQSHLISAFGEALTQIHYQQATDGQLSSIWIYIAKYYRQQCDLQNSNSILFKATQQKFKTIQEYVQIWRYWIETLIYEQHYEDAMTVLKKALFGQKQQDQDANAQSEHMRTNVELWSLYIDLEVNLGSVETIKAAYQKMLELKVMTPLICMNYIQFLESEEYFEQSYKVFEQALSIFNQKSSQYLLINYAYKFVSRYKGGKLERARDLFEKAIASHSQEKLFYLMYAQFEEQYGLLNHAIEIYDRMLSHIEENKLSLYYLYITKVAHYLGITKTRVIFEKGIHQLRGQQMHQLSLKYHQLELRLGEIDRARSILLHLVQFVSLADDPLDLWTTLDNFEKQYGNVDTYKDYLRLKRAVAIKFSLNAPDISRLIQKIHAQNPTPTLQQQQQDNLLSPNHNQQQLIS